MAIYIDSHFHLLSMKEKGVDTDQLLDTMKEKGMLGVDIGTECDDLAYRLPEVRKYPSLLYSAGIGPWATDNDMEIDEQLDIFRNTIAGENICAIGEIGLDNYWKYGTVEKQEYLFRKQIEMAIDMNLPIIIHNREADSQMVDILTQYHFERNNIMHCFSGNREILDVALSKGFYISFAGNSTFKRNTEMREMMRLVPHDRLLLETDSPYLSPEPFRGKTNTPLRMETIYERAAENLEMNTEELMIQIERNFRTLFSL